MGTLTIATLVVVSYFCMLAAGIVASQPIRMALAERADAMADEGGWTKAERAELEWLVVSSSSSVVGLMLPFASLFTFVSVALGAPVKDEPELDRLRRDTRFHGLIGRYFASVALCSPIAATLALPGIAGSVIAQALRGRPHLSDAMEAPVLRASAAFQPC